MSKVSSQKEGESQLRGLPSTEDNFLGTSLKSPVIVGPSHPWSRLRTTLTEASPVILLPPECLDSVVCCLTK